MESETMKTLKQQYPRHGRPCRVITKDDVTDAWCRGVCYPDSNLESMLVEFVAQDIRDSLTVGQWSRLRVGMRQGQDFAKESK